MKELGLYIHIPFCKQKCKYCDFISYADKNSFIEEYVNIIIKEIEQNKKLADDYEVSTIYFGGGTPSYIESNYIVEILSIIKEIVASEKIKFPLRVLGPAQSGIARINGKYRYRLILKCKNNSQTREFIRKILLKTAEYREFSNVNIYADMNGEII